MVDDNAVDEVTPGDQPGQPSEQGGRKKMKPEWTMFTDDGIFDPNSKDPTMKSAKCKYCSKTVRGKIETMASHILSCPSMSKAALKA